MEEEEFFESGNQESLKQYNDYNVGYVADGDIARLRSKFRVVSQSVQELEETLARSDQISLVWIMNHISTSRIRNVRQHNDFTLHFTFFRIKLRSCRFKQLNPCQHMDNNLVFN